MKQHLAREHSHSKSLPVKSADVFAVKMKLIICLVLVPFLFVACLGNKPEVEQFILDWDNQSTGSNRVAILPFENKTDSEDIDKKVRESFYKHFSLKNYHDIEIHEIDRTLQIIDQTSSKSWLDLSPQTLGSFFQADYIITGEVLEFDKYFLGIYSQVSLTATARVFRCKDGKKVWESILTKRSHDGSVPFGLIGVIPAAVRSGVHLLDERAFDLIERFNRELVSQIPDPTQPMAMTSPFFVELQVASFQERERAEKTRREIEDKGFSPRIETALLDNQKWHRVILGPYFNIKDAESAREKIRTGWAFQPIYIHHYTQNLNSPESKKE